MKPGRLSIRGEPTTPRRLLDRASIVLRNADHQLYMKTARDEILWSAHRIPKDRRADQVRKILADLGLSEMADRYPQFLHARECVRKAGDLFDGNRVMGSFLCQGGIDPAVVEMMKQHASDIHPMTPERMANIQAAESHPDETDLANARTVFEQMVRELQERGNR